MGFGDPRAGQDATLRHAAEQVGADPAPTEGSEDHEAHAAGRICEKCGVELTTSDDARRTASGEWAHETCPVPMPSTGLLAPNATG